MAEASRIRREAERDAVGLRAEGRAAGLRALERAATQIGTLLVDLRVSAESLDGGDRGSVGRSGAPARGAAGGEHVGWTIEAAASEPAGGTVGARGASEAFCARSGEPRAPGAWIAELGRDPAAASGPAAARDSVAASDAEAIPAPGATPDPAAIPAPRATPDPAAGPDPEPHTFQIRAYSRASMRESPLADLFRATDF